MEDKKFLDISELDSVAGGQKWGQSKSLAETDPKLLRNALAKKAGDEDDEPANSGGDLGRFFDGRRK